MQKNKERISCLQKSKLSWTAPDLTKNMEYERIINKRKRLKNSQSLMEQRLQLNEIEKKKTFKKKKVLIVATIQELNELKSRS